jgi:hypothetical protein
VAVRKIVYVREDDDHALIGHVIEYEGKLWLVPEWLEGPTPGTRSPARIICLDGLPLATPAPEYRADLALARPLSRGVLEGRAIGLALDVRERPDIHLRVDTDFLC